MLSAATWRHGSIAHKQYYRAGRHHRPSRNVYTVDSTVLLMAGFGLMVFRALSPKSASRWLAAGESPSLQTIGHYDAARAQWIHD